MPADALNLGLSPVAANFYPVTSALYIEDPHAKMAVMNDRPQAGSAYKEGRIELLFNRRGTHEDCLGLGESCNCNEAKPARTSHRYWVKFSRHRDEIFQTILKQ